MDQKLDQKLLVFKQEFRKEIKEDLEQLRKDIHDDIGDLLEFSINPLFDEHHQRITRLEKAVNIS